MESASKNNFNNKQQEIIEVPVAIPVMDGGGDWSPSAGDVYEAYHDDERARFVTNQSQVIAAHAEVIPTYEMIDHSTTSNVNRNYGDQQQLQVAEANAKVSASTEFWQDQAGKKGFRHVDQESENIVKAANKDARRRDKEGLEVRKQQVYGIPPQKVVEVMAHAVTKEDAKAATTNNSKGGDGGVAATADGGYQVREYETKEYTSKEYQSNYEYKSVYD